MSPRLRIAFLALIAIAAAVSTAAIVLLATGTGGEPPRKIGGGFTLTSEDGTRVSDTDFRGKTMLMFFGFTNCPDVCPMSLQKMADAFDAAPELKAKVVPILVSVDPGRDTPEKLREYVAYFGPEFRGLTGTPDEIGAMLKAYGVYAKRVDLPDSALEYTVDHSSFIYAFGPDGGFLTVLDPSQDAAALAARMKEIVK